MAEETRPSYRLAAKMMELPLDQFEKEFELETRKQAGNPVFKTFFPAVSHLRRSLARADVRRALLATALDVQLDGPDALKNHPDPVVGGPFELRPLRGRLRVALEVQADERQAVGADRRPARKMSCRVEPRPDRAISTPPGTSVVPTVSAG